MRGRGERRRGLRCSSARKQHPFVITEGVYHALWRRPIRASGIDCVDTAQHGTDLSGGGCAHEFEKCTTTAECCNAGSGEACVNGRCTIIFR